MSSETARFDCSDLRHKKYAHCLHHERAFECRVPFVNITLTIRSVADIERAIRCARTCPEAMQLPDTSILVRMQVCIAQTVTQFSWEALRVSNAIDANEQWPWQGTWYDQPAIFAEARQVIDEERARVDRIGNKGTKTSVR